MSCILSFITGVTADKTQSEASHFMSASKFHVILIKAKLTEWNNYDIGHYSVLSRWLKVHDNEIFNKNGGMTNTAANILGLHCSQSITAG